MDQIKCDVLDSEREKKQLGMKEAYLKIKENHSSPSKEVW